jgi:hypothetical protein
MYAVNNVLGLSLEEMATFDKILEGSLALAMEDSKTSSIGQLKKMFETFADYVDIDQRLADRINNFLSCPMEEVLLSSIARARLPSSILSKVAISSRLKPSTLLTAYIINSYQCS